MSKPELKPPPDRDRSPHDASPLDDAGVIESSRLRPNAALLISWVEWLLHPEEHSYDRLVQHPDGEWKEEPGNVGPEWTPDSTELENYEYKSVIHNYEPWQFIHGMAAASRQQVERDDTLLGIGAAAMENIWYLGDKRISEHVDALQNLRTQNLWTGPASDAAFEFLNKMQTVAGAINKLVEDFKANCLRYAVIIKGLRDNLDEAAVSLISAFQDKFYNKPESEFTKSMVGAVLAGIAAAAVTYFSGGTAGMILGGYVGTVWSGAFTESATKLLLPDPEHDETKGYWWHELVSSYMTSQQSIVREAKAEVDTLKGSIEELLNRLKNDEDIEAFMTRYAG